MAARRRSSTTGASISTQTERRVRAVDAPWTLPAPVAREVVVPTGTTRSPSSVGSTRPGSSTASVVTVAVATGRSQPAGTLAEAVHDAAGVRDGRRILVFGGRGPSGDGTADVQRSAADGTSSVIGRLPGAAPITWRRAVGRATYVFGGYDGAADRARHPPDHRRLDVHHGRCVARAGALPGARGRRHGGLPVRRGEQLGTRHRHPRGAAVRHRIGRDRHRRRSCRRRCRTRARSCSAARCTCSAATSTTTG